MVARGLTLGEAPAAALSSRIVGTYDAGLPGPLVVVVGGLHGNEPAGVLAARRVLASLERDRPPFRGRLVALAGNLGALSAVRRFLREDLNRLWTDERLAALRGRSAAELADEDREQAELVVEIERALAERSWPLVCLLDLHSTSAAGAPFSIMADTLQNRRVAFALPIPVLLGLEERVAGTLLSHFSDQGHVAICVEGGQNDAPSTVAHHVASLWITLVAAGALDEEHASWVEGERERLAETAWGLPRVVEVRYRFPVPRDTRFEMLPGYTNFEPVRRGEVLAHLGALPGTEVQSPADGLLLMPRYQGQGEDGFFVGREVRRFWLGLSALLRRTRLQWALRLLPGVRRDPGRRDALRVDPRVARFLVVELFHLFGYRWARNEAEELVFLRRADRP